MQRLIRGMRHLFSPPWTVGSHFGSGALDRIEAVVTESELRHGAEIRVVIEASLSFVDVVWHNRKPRERAVQVFSDLQVWDTELNNGILIYLLLADHDVEIVADRGASQQVPAAVWEQAVTLVRDSCAAGQVEQGVEAAVRFLGDALAQAFAPEARNPDELPNRPAVI